MHPLRANQFVFVVLRLSQILACMGLLLCAAALFTGCKRSASSQIGRLRLTDTELRYGVAPTRNSEVVYQDDVIIVGHGADDVRSVSADGLTWTIDASAARAEELQPGKIMFITARGVGRVLGVQRTGDGLAVVLGPVALTDVIKETHMSFEQPVDLSNMIAYSAPEFPGTSVEAFRLSPLSGPEGGYVVAETGRRWPSGRWDQGDGTWWKSEPQRRESAWNDSTGAALRLSPASFTNFAAFSPPLPLPQLGTPSQVDISDFKVVPFCCGGLGLKIVHDSDGVRIMAYAVIRLKDPALRFNLDIHGGKVTTAELELKGMAGLTMQFEAASTVGVNGNINKQISVPVDLSLPILGLPVPLAVTLHQAFILKTAFSARNSVLRATGDYALGGSLFMGYHDGSWGAGAPTKFVVRQSLLDSINGVSLGANGLVMAYQGKVIVGIGAFGFVTGPYFGYNVGIGVARGSDAAGLPLGMPVCRSANLDVGVAVGIGYSIPQPVTKAINFILRNLNLRTIEGTGGIEHRESLIQQHAALPAGCG